MRNWRMNLCTACLAGTVLSNISLPVASADEAPSTLLTAASATTLSGYVDTSAQWNLGTGNANMPNYAFGGSSKADGFNLNVVKLALERSAENGDNWAAGYKVDLFFGPDANLLNTVSISSSGHPADFAVKQAYVSLHAPLANGLDFKMGVWDTIIGYEVTDAILNPNFTRSYGYTIEPPTHTGVQAIYAFCSALTATIAVSDTYGPRINERTFPARAESYKTYMGSILFTAPTNWGVLAGSTLSACVMNGFNSTSPASTVPANQTSWYVGGTVNTPVTGLRVGVAYDYAGVSGQPLTAGQSGYANAVGLYASYQITEKIALFARGEYATSNVRSTFLARKIFEATATLQYDLWKNVLSRLEFRWDHAADGSSPFGGTVTGAGTQHNSYVLLADFAYKF